MAETQIINTDGVQVPDVKRSTAQVTGTALDETFTLIGRGRILNITINADGSVTDDVVVSIDSIEGADYDTVILNQTDTWQDILITGEQNDIYEKGDAIKIVCANTVTAKISIVFTYEKL